MDQQGRIIGGRYEIEARLGEGGMGAVFRAFDAVAGRRVALKLLQADVARDPVQVERFRRESSVLCGIEHPGLVRLLDASFDGEPYLVFEVVEGKSLDRVVDGRPLSLQQALTYTRALCDAVAALHAHKILHRDLKPSNVMVRPDGSICLLDFGIAKHYGDAQRTLDRLTSAGYVVGTPQYMPPEGLFGGDILPAYDVWSIGVMFYEMVTGKRPFAAFEHSVPELATALMARSYVPPSQVQGGLPKVVDAWIERFLEPKPERRPKDGAEARDVLAELDVLTSGVHPRGSPATLMVAQMTPRVSRPVAPIDPPTPIARASGRIPAPAAPAPVAAPVRPLVAGLVALVAFGTAVGVALKPAPRPVAPATPSVAAPDRSVVRAALRELAAWSEPADLEKFLATVMSSPVDTAKDRERANSRLRPTLAAMRLERPLSRLLSGPEEPGDVLDAPDEREAWARLGWLCLVEHACDQAKLRWPYPKRLVAQVDRYWPPTPANGAGGDDWKHLIFRLTDPQRRDKLFGDDPDGFAFVPAPFTYRFELAGPPSAVRVWFASRDLAPSHALLVRFNGNPPVAVHTAAPQERRPAVALRPALLEGVMAGDPLPDGRFSLMHDRGELRDRVYVGRAVPPHWLRSGKNEMVVSLISLYNPQHPVKGTQPSIWAKIVSYK